MEHTLRTAGLNAVFFSANHIVLAGENGGEVMGGGGLYINIFMETVL